MFRHGLGCATAFVILGVFHLASVQDKSYLQSLAQSLASAQEISEAPPYQHALHITAGRTDVPSCGTYPRCDIIPAGTDVNVGVLITNVSDHAVTYRNLRWGPATEFEVRDADGNLAPESEELLQLKQDFYKDGQWRGHVRGHPELDDPRKITGHREWVGPLFDDQQTLEPGKSVSFGVMPNRYYDMRPPGVYSIVAKRQNDESPHEWVYSNEVKVTILPARSEGDPIKVISASNPEKTGVVVTAELNGAPAKMTCRFSVSNCAAPQPGDYLFVTASAEAEGYNAYDDCLNVYLYSKDREGVRDRRIGVYCLLSNP